MDLAITQDGIQIVERASLVFVAMAAIGIFGLYVTAVAWGIKHGKIFKGRHGSAACSPCDGKRDLRTPVPLE